MNQGGAAVKVSSTAVKGQMKGLLKGLRYISQIFDEEDQQKEIQIGFPTDVKHLAHIGCDDAKANAPSWMIEFKETPQPSPGATAANSTKNSEGQDSGYTSDYNKASDGKRHHIRKARHRSSDSQSSINTSPPPDGSSEGTAKPSQRHHSTDSSKVHGRQSSEEDPTTTKHSHRRKSKTSSEEKENSTRKHRIRRSSKANDSLSDISFTDNGPGPRSGSAAL